MMMESGSHIVWYHNGIINRWWTPGQILINWFLWRLSLMYLVPLYHNEVIMSSSSQLITFFMILTLFLVHFVLDLPKTTWLHVILTFNQQKPKNMSNLNIHLRNYFTFETLISTANTLYSKLYHIYYFIHIQMNISL